MGKVSIRVQLLIYFTPYDKYANFLGKPLCEGNLIFIIILREGEKERDLMSEPSHLPLHSLRSLNELTIFN